MNIYAFNDSLEKMPIEVYEGTATVPVGGTATAEYTSSVVGGKNPDFRDYAVLSIMTGYGDDVGDTYFATDMNPITPMFVKDGVVYPSVEMNFYKESLGTSYNRFKVNLYNNASTNSTKMWYRVVMIKVSNDHD